MVEEKEVAGIANEAGVRESLREDLAHVRQELLFERPCVRGAVSSSPLLPCHLAL